MKGFIATIKPLRAAGHTSLIYMTEEARELGISPGDRIACIVAPAERSEDLLSSFYGSDRHMFFVAARIEDGKPAYLIQKAVSELQIRNENRDFFAVLGPVEDMGSAHDLIEHLESVPIQPTEVCLKKQFREFRHSRRGSDA